jgi:hypothetical protein
VRFHYVVFYCQIGATTNELDFDAPRVIGDTLQAVAQLVAEGKALGISAGSVSGHSGSIEADPQPDSKTPVPTDTVAPVSSDLAALLLTSTTPTSSHGAGTTAAQDAKADAIVTAAIEAVSGAGSVSQASTLSSDATHEQKMALISSSMTEAAYIRDCEQNQLFVPLAIFRYTPFAPNNIHM